MLTLSYAEPFWTLPAQINSSIATWRKTLKMSSQVRRQKVTHKLFELNIRENREVTHGPMMADLKSPRSTFT